MCMHVNCDEHNLQCRSVRKKTKDLIIAFEASKKYKYNYYGHEWLVEKSEKRAAKPCIHTCIYSGGFMMAQSR